MSRCLSHYQESRGMFDRLTEETKIIVMEIVACFHCRTGINQIDGSRGEIRITPKEMNDMIAYALKLERS